MYWTSSGETIERQRERWEAEYNVVSGTYSLTTSIEDSANDTEQETLGSWWERGKRLILVWRSRHAHRFIAIYSRPLCQTILILVLAHSTLNPGCTHSGSKHGAERVKIKAVRNNDREKSSIPVTDNQWRLREGELARVQGRSNREKPVDKHIIIKKIMLKECQNGRF